MVRSVRAAGLAGVLVIACAGCGGAMPERSAAKPPSVASSLPAAPPTLIASPTSADPDPAVAASKVLLVWSRPRAAYERWWGDLAPLLSPQGQQDYSGTDPALIPTLTVVGPGKVVGNGPVSCLVEIPTSSGTFGVRLSRAAVGDEWLASEIVFPPDVPGRVV